MRRAAKTLGGLLAGFVAGSLLLNTPVFARLAPAAVTWDAATCPAGVYTLNATATSLDGRGSFETALHDLRLPAVSVTQVFENLPTGRFMVTAILTNDAGEQVGSASQLLVASPPSVRAPKVSKVGTRGAVSAPAPPPGNSARNPGRPGGNVATVPPAAARTEPSVIRLSELSELIGDGSDVRQLDLIDLNDDGEVDVLRIESKTGAVREWRILR